MKNYTLIILASVLTLTTLSSQVFLNEDFEGLGLPDGWTTVTNASDGGWISGTATSLSSEFFEIPSNGSARFVATNDDQCNCNKRDEYLVTPSIDLSGTDGAFLYFDSYFTEGSFQNNQESATIELSLDGGNWISLESVHGHDSWDRHVVNISEFLLLGEIQIGFRYSDNGGWLFGFGIDNVTIEAPAALEAALIDIDETKIGIVSKPITLGGSLQNLGSSPIDEFQINYYVDGELKKEQNFSDQRVQPLQVYQFEFPETEVFTEPGIYFIELEIFSLNGENDENQEDNIKSFTLEVFEGHTIPNVIPEILNGGYDLVEQSDASIYLNKPTDLDFFPLLGKDELWIVNERTESDGGSTLTIQDASTNPSDYLHRVDGNAWHFMSLPTGIAFSNDNLNFATSPGVQDANHSGGTFTGPTLWSSDPDIYAQPSGGNGSHLDMLHGSPKSMGIAHERDNVFWVYDNWNKDIVRYDFVDDHGPGNDYHGDAIVRRFENIGITGSGDIPNHLKLDEEKKWLYFCDNGNNRVMRLDINSGTGKGNLPLINEALAEHSSVNGFTVEEIISTGLSTPSGIDIFENYLLVGNYLSGDIIIYDVQNAFAELGRVETNAPGLTGITIGPDGSIWYTNRLRNSLSCIKPTNVSATENSIQEVGFKIYPNPSHDYIFIESDKSIGDAKVEIFNNEGSRVLAIEKLGNRSKINLPDIIPGTYALKLTQGAITTTQVLTILR